MTFLASAVAQTIGPVLDGIIAAWPALPAEVQATIDRAIRAQGPLIAQAGSGFYAAGEAGKFLDALWPVRQSLPADVRKLLEDGQVEAQSRSSYRSTDMGSLAAEQQKQILQRLLAIVDFRVFDDPSAVALELGSLVALYRERLTDVERAQWDVLQQAFRQDNDADRFLGAAEKLLGEYPQVANLLTKHKVWVRKPIMRGGDPISSGPQRGAPGDAVAKGGFSEPIGRGVGAGAADEVSRYANVHFPSKVLIDQGAVPLIVHVAGHFQPGAVGTADEARMSLKLSPLTVVVRAEGFEVTGETIGGEAVEGAEAYVRRVQVFKERDCEPLVFFLKPQTAGPRRISVDFEQFSRRLMTLAFGVEIVDDASAMKELTQAVVPMQSIVSPVLGAAAEPPDIELRITLSEDRKTLAYMLHSPKGSDYNFKQVGSRSLREDPLTFLGPVFERLSTLAKRSAAARTEDETQGAVESLAADGVQLYNELFSDELKREYNKVLRKKYRGRSLLITSGDPWIPWELVTPQDPGDDEPWEQPNDPPLCETFQLSRWVDGRGAPDQVKLAIGTWVAPPDNLQAAQVESDYFAELHRREWEVSLNGPLKSLAEVTQALRGGKTHLYHFACHGNFDAASATESKLKLGTQFLTPRDVGALKPFIRQSKPVVFLNACHSGRVGVGLTQLGGWAQTFLDCEASAFIGSLWEVNDALAAQFAKEFYNRLWGLEGFARQDLGQAFYEARMAIKLADPANPTWLAYVLYGDPHGQVMLGAA